jgi:prepilin-type N-terminal cleavage/methylation domain-containing protein
MKSAKPRWFRSGLTLIELIVVLVILVALAGILVPMLPSMLTRSHTARGVTNMGEVTKFVQTYEQLYQSYLSDFDALVDGASAVALPEYVMVTGGQMVVDTLTAGERAALAAAGIVRLKTMHPTRAALAPDGSPTFHPYNGGVIDLTAGTPTVAFVSEQAVKQDTRLVSDPNGLRGDRYVVFGLGKRCTMIGKTIADPPVHFSDTTTERPEQVYARYGLVFQVAKGNGVGNPATPLGRAVFVGTVEFHREGLGTKDAHMEEYYKIE